MSGVLDFAAGRFRVLRNGRVAFDTQTPAARLAPSKKLLLSDYSIEFPDLVKGIFYTMVNGRNVSLGTYQGAASSYIALIGQEWGPGEASPFNLPDIVLGPAPVGANYLNTKLNLIRSVTPAKIFGDLVIPGMIPAGKWTRVEGASSLIESYGPLRRMIDILIVGGNIVLRRRQSIIDTVGSVERRNVSYSTSDGPHTYYHPGTPGTNAGYSNGHYAEIGEWLQNKSSGSSAASISPGGSNGCTLDTTLKSYRSVWTGQLEITPGRIG